MWQNFQCDMATKTLYRSAMFRSLSRRKDEILPGGPSKRRAWSLQSARAAAWRHSSMHLVTTNLVCCSTWRFPEGSLHGSKTLHTLLKPPAAWPPANEVWSDTSQIDVLNAKTEIESYKPKVENLSGARDASTEYGWIRRSAILKFLVWPNLAGVKRCNCTACNILCVSKKKNEQWQNRMLQLDVLLLHWTITWCFRYSLFDKACQKGYLVGQ